jgi:hypothetical protein
LHAAQGDFRADKRDGRGTDWFAGGQTEVNIYVEGERKGTGVCWAADQQEAWRLLDGDPQEDVSLDAARALAAQIGMHVPKLAPPA